MTPVQASVKLCATIVQCNSLGKKEGKGAVNAYVRLFLIPGDYKDYNTRVTKNNNDPTFNEDFYFDVGASPKYCSNILLIKQQLIY